MISLRSIIWTLGALCGFAFFATEAQAQDLPRKDSGAFQEAFRWASNETRGIPREELENTRGKFKLVAKYFADMVSNPTILKASIDPKFGPNRLPTLDRDPNTGVFNDLDKLLLDPTIPYPTIRQVPPEKLVYMNELGAAFDAAIKPLLTSPERIIRINAARLLVEVCRSGARPYWATVTGLIKSPDTPTEIKNYAFQAAAHLLAAYDITDYKLRKHNNDDEKVAELAEAISACIIKPENLLKGFKRETATPDQLAVIGFVRRNAVHALGKVRFIKILGQNKQPVYPAYTLCQVCVSDPVLTPASSPNECVEAVIGLCNMAPAADGRAIKGYNADAVVEAMWSGLATFAADRADPNNHSLPWRHYGIELKNAFNGWRPLFDPVFDPTSPNQFLDLMPASAKDLMGRVDNLIVQPISKVDSKGNPDPGSGINVGAIQQMAGQLRSNPNRNPQVYADNPNTVLKYPAKE